MSNRLAMGLLCTGLVLAPGASLAAQRDDYHGYFTSKPISEGMLDCEPKVYSKALHKIQLKCSQGYFDDFVYFSGYVVFLDTQTGHRHRVSVKPGQNVDFATEKPLPYTETTPPAHACQFGSEKQGDRYVPVASATGQKVTYTGDPDTVPYPIACGIAPDGHLNLFVETGHDKDRSGSFVTHDLHMVTAQKNMDLGVVASPQLEQGHINPGGTVFYKVINGPAYMIGAAGSELVVLDLSTGDLKTYTARPGIYWLDYDPGTHTALIALSHAAPPPPVPTTDPGSFPVDLCEASVETQTCLPGKPVVASDLSIYTPMFDLSQRYADGDGFMPLLQTARSAYYWF